MATPKLPRLDPSFTVSDLQAAAHKFIEAGKEYWTAAQKAGIGGALIWYDDGNHGLVIYTRGEYRDTLLRNIPEIGPVKTFGGASDDVYGRQNRDRENLHPHAEAIAAMFLYGADYAAQRGGSNDFWEALPESRKRVCRDLVEKVTTAKRERT